MKKNFYLKYCVFVITLIVLLSASTYCDRTGNPKTAIFFVVIFIIVLYISTLYWIWDDNFLK